MSEIKSYPLPEFCSDCGIIARRVDDSSRFVCPKCRSEFIKLSFITIGYPPFSTREKWDRMHSVSRAARGRPGLT